MSEKQDLENQVLEYVAGDNALDHQPLDLDSISRIGTMVRRIHDVSELFPIPEQSWSTIIPTANANLMCHNDLAPWNLIMGKQWSFIDWDGAGPSTRRWDLAYASQSFAMLIDGEPTETAALRLRAFVDGYGADQALREALPAAISERTAAMFTFLHKSHLDGTQPWADMFRDGHGEFWRAASEYVKRNEETWARALNASHATNSATTPTRKQGVNERNDGH